MRYKRAIADFCERVTGRIITSPGEAHLIPERLHLSNLFKLFAVDCVFDVGANAGQYKQMLREKVRFHGPIISYEPVPELVEVMRKRSKHDSKWFVEPFALGDKAGSAIFNVMIGSQFSSFKTPLNSQMGSGNNKVAREINVETSTLELQLQNYRDRIKFTRPFLKLDTQGNDLAVVAGAGRHISSFIGLQSELSFKPVYEDTPGIWETIDYFDKIGFELSALVPNNAGHFPRLYEMDGIFCRRD